MAYELHDWPGIQGRGEFVRLALEASGAPYVDVARGAETAGQGVPAMLRCLNDSKLPHPPLAPPFLKDGALVVGQTSAILLYLAPTLKLVGRSEQLRVWTHQIQLAIDDAVIEAHDTHHPLGSGLNDEDPLPEALRRTDEFCRIRMPQYLQWFERLIVRNPAGPRQLAGGKLSYADLSLFQLIEGLRYAFPNAARKALAKTPEIVQLHDRVAALPKLAEYLRSERRIPFNEQGIFRCYPERDLA